MSADLIERLEKATGPDRKLDALIEVEARRFEAYRVGLNDEQRAHWKPVGTKGEVEEGGTRYHSPEYTRSIDAALTLVPEGWQVDNWFIGTDKSSRLDLRCISTAKPIPRECGEHDASAAIALCIAALKARASRNPPARG